MGRYEFGETLIALRTEAGDKSSRSFYNRAGGRRFFVCTYRQYLNVEAGKQIPRPALLEKLALRLRLEDHPERAERFFRSYMRSVLGGGEMYELMLRSVSPRRSKGEASADSGLEAALARKAEAKKVPLSISQAECLNAHMENFWVFASLVHDDEHWKPETLAKALKFKVPAVRRALQQLCGHKIVQRDKAGSYFIPPGRIFENPREKLGWHPYRVSRQLDRFLDKRGRTLFTHYFLLRASTSEIKSYYPNLIRTLKGADAFLRTKKGEDTSLMLLETRIREALPF